MFQDAHDTQAKPRNIAKELQQTFHLKGLRKLADYGLTDQYKLDALHVINRYEDARQKEIRDFNLHFKDRVNSEIKVLQNEAGSKTREHNHPWFGKDQFSRSSLELRAERRVRHAHEATLNLLDRQEAYELEAIVERSECDPETPDIGKGFERAKDPQASQDRQGEKMRDGLQGKAQGQSQSQSQPRSRSRSRSR